VNGDHDKLQVWAIFRNPVDAPGKFILRRYDGETPTNEAYAAETLELVRQFLPPGLFPLAPMEGDVTGLVETWL
jgi:hypothetical protein